MRFIELTIYDEDGVKIPNLINVESIKTAHGVYLDRGRYRTKICFKTGGHIYVLEKYEEVRNLLDRFIVE